MNYEKHKRLQILRLTDEIIPKLYSELDSAKKYHEYKLPREWVIEDFYQRLLREIHEIEELYGKNKDD